MPHSISPLFTPPVGRNSPHAPSQPPPAAPPPLSTATPGRTWVATRARAAREPKSLPPPAPLPDFFASGWGMEGAVARYGRPRRGVGGGGGGGGARRGRSVAGGRNQAGYLPAQRSWDALARSLTFALCRVQRKARTRSLFRGRRPCGVGETAWLPLVGNVGGYQIARRERGRRGSGPTFVLQCVRAHVCGCV